MNPRWRVVALAAATVVSAAHGTEASHEYIGSQSIRITTPGIDFGDEVFIAGAPVGSGDVHWFIVDGQINPVVNGRLHLTRASGQCARLKVDYYAGNGVLAGTRHSAQACAEDDSHRGVAVSVVDYRSNKVDEVQVTLQRKIGDGDWTSLGSQRSALITVHDPVRITEDGFDFGGEDFVLGAPTGSGQLSWSWSGGQVVPRLTGTLHINNSASACARIRIEYLAAGGERLAEAAGGKVCAADNRHHAWNVDLQPYTSGRIIQVRVGIQTLAGDDTWRTVGYQEIYYAHLPVRYWPYAWGVLGSVTGPRRELK